MTELEKLRHETNALQARGIVERQLIVWLLAAAMSGKRIDPKTASDVIDLQMDRLAKQNFDHIAYLEFAEKMKEMKDEYLRAADALSREM